MQLRQLSQLSLEDSKNSWWSISLLFFRTFQYQEDYASQRLLDEDDEIGKTETDEKDVLKSMKKGLLFQIMFNKLHNGNKRTPFYVMNVVEIYERWKSRKDCASVMLAQKWIVMTSPSLLSLIHLSLVC